MLGLFSMETPSHADGVLSHIDGIGTVARVVDSAAFGLVLLGEDLYGLGTAVGDAWEDVDTRAKMQKKSAIAKVVDLLVDRLARLLGTGNVVVDCSS